MNFKITFADNVAELKKLTVTIDVLKLIYACALNVVFIILIVDVLRSCMSIHTTINFIQF